MSPVFYLPVSKPAIFQLYLPHSRIRDPSLQSTGLFGGGKWVALHFFLGGKWVVSKENDEENGESTLGLFPCNPLKVTIPRNLMAVLSQRGGVQPTSQKAHISDSIKLVLLIFGGLQAMRRSQEAETPSQVGWDSTRTCPNHKWVRADVGGLVILYMGLG